MDASGTPLVLLAAGGTGGHLFPAEALADALHKRGITTDLATDHRASHFKFPAREVHVVPSATVRGRDPLSLMRTATLLALGTAKAWSILRRIRPDVVVGFGGYPTVPPLLAASLHGVPTILHEQNGVMGRANKFLAPRVTAIATGFRVLKNLNAQWQSKVTFTGNPVRPQVIAAAETSYTASKPKQNLLVFGGSQGARVMAEIVPSAIEPLECRSPQATVNRPAGPCRGHRCRTLGLCEIWCRSRNRSVFFRSASANGGGTTGYFPFRRLDSRGAFGHRQASVLVPLPHALDQDQFVNAGVLEESGGAIRIEQRDFTPQRLATEITALLSDPARLPAWRGRPKEPAPPPRPTGWPILC